MHHRTLTIHVEFPALDRLLDYLQSSDQAAIDATTGAVVSATNRLKQSASALQSAVTKEQQ